VCDISISSPIRKPDFLVVCLLLHKLKRLISACRYTVGLAVANRCCTQMYFHVLLVGELSEEKFKSLPCLTSLWFCRSRTGFFGTIVEYGAERKISRHSILGATVSVGVPQGVSLKIKSVQHYNSGL